MNLFDAARIGVGTNVGWDNRQLRNARTKTVGFAAKRSQSTSPTRSAWGRSDERSKVREGDYTVIEHYSGIHNSRRPSPGPSLRSARPLPAFGGRGSEIRLSMFDSPFTAACPTLLTIRRFSPQPHHRPRRHRAILQQKQKQNPMLCHWPLAENVSGSAVLQNWMRL